MTPFATFGLLYMIATFLELSEVWKHPVYTAAILVWIVVAVFTRVTRVTLLVFLAVATAHFVWLLPDVANHVNLMVFVNVFMMTMIGWSLTRPDLVTSDDDYYRMFRPFLQSTLILVYVLAGFHKLNVDFLNPEVSCVDQTFARLRRMARSDVLGIPTPVWMTALATGVTWVLSRGTSPVLRVCVAIATAGVTMATLVVLGVDRFRPLRELMIPPTIAVVLGWELVGGAALAFPSLQLPMIAFSWVMHASLAMVRFVDFGGLALVLLCSFVPESHQRMMGESVAIGRGSLTIPRPKIYAGFCVAAGIVSPFSAPGAGLLFNTGALCLLWPLVRTQILRIGPAWEGIPLRRGRMPLWLALAPLLLVLYAGTSYLGLRTAGNFSMFSNLRTEGDRSNHLLLGSNPLKIWGYQEDVVRFIAIDDRTARVGHQYHYLQGQLLPVVEFRKLVLAWTQAGMVVPLTFEYNGVTYVTDDIVNDPTWRTSGRDLEMRLMDFRLIQPDGPNRCRW